MSTAGENFHRFINLKIDFLRQIHADEELERFFTISAQM